MQQYSKIIYIVIQASNEMEATPQEEYLQLLWYDDVNEYQTQTNIHQAARLLYLNSFQRAL